MQKFPGGEYVRSHILKRTLSITFLRASRPLSALARSAALPGRARRVAPTPGGRVPRCPAGRRAASILLSGGPADESRPARARRAGVRQTAATTSRRRPDATQIRTVPVMAPRRLCPSWIQRGSETEVDPRRIRTSVDPDPSEIRENPGRIHPGSSQADPRRARVGPERARVPPTRPAAPPFSESHNAPV